MSRITFGGLIATAIYVGAIATYVVYDFAAVRAMKPNEMGDFLAGTFGPLAFFWLICGYLQQGVELKQNTEALRLQVTELQNSVEHQRVLAEVAREQLRNDAEAAAKQQEFSRRDALPVFDAVVGGGIGGASNANVSVRVRNIGGFVFGVQVSRPPAPASFSHQDIRQWEIGDEHEFTWFVRKDESLEPFDFSVSFVDRLGNPGAATFQITYRPANDKDYRFETIVAVINPA